MRLVAVIQVSRSSKIPGRFENIIYTFSSARIFTLAAQLKAHTETGVQA